MDIYVVMDGARVVGASARLQGAELLRSDHAAALADRAVNKLADRALRTWNGDRSIDVWQTENRIAYEGTRIVNKELQDVED